jgi:predicted glycosyltransferase
MYLSFSSPYPAHISSLLRKPNIALNDTEHADKISSRFTFPFCDVILTPFCHENNLGKNHIKFNNLTEGLYLHRKYFNPDRSILELLKLKPNEKYVIVRFVSWNAHHDYGQFGLDIETKRKLIEILSTKYKVIISSESELPSEFKKFQFHISPNKMHDALAFAEMFIGESATMASESAMLGTYAVYINSLPLMGYLRVEKNEGLLQHFNSPKGVLDSIKILMEDTNLKKNAIDNSNRMKQNFIDPTEFLLWIIENYPESSKLLKSNSNYQAKFLS